MKKFFSGVVARFQTMDRNELSYILGLIMMLIGITYAISLFVAMVVVGGIMVVESVLTSYLAQWIKTRKMQ
jgi:hypothetical protein